MPLTEFLTIASSVLLFGYAVFHWNKERLITKNAVSYIQSQHDHLTDTDDLKHTEVEGAWADLWQRLQSSIIEVPGVISSQQKRTSIKPEELFTLSYTQKKFGLDLGAIASRPSNLTGVGITFTFLGLVIGVSNASGALLNINSGAESSLLLMIAPLLQGAGLAFTTSLAGLLGSLVYSVGTRSIANSLQREIDKWNQRLNEICPVISPSELQMIMICQNEQQVHQMEQLPKHVTSGIGSGISQIMDDIKTSIKERDESSARMMESKFDGMITAFNDNIGTMSDGFNHSLDSMANSFSSSLDKLTKNFNRSIRQMAGDEMELFANQLKTLHQDYVAAQQQIIEQKDEFLTKSTNHALHAFTQTSEMSALLKKCTTQIANMTGEIVDHVDGLQESMNTWVNREVAAGGKIIASSLESFGATLTEDADKAGHILVTASEDSRDLLIAAAQSISDKYDNISTTISQGATQLSDSLGQSGDIIAKTLATGIKHEVDSHYISLGEKLDHHIQAQKGLWETHEKQLKITYESHNREVTALRNQFGDAFNNALTEFKKFEESTNKYVEGLDSDATKVLTTLSRSIDEMQRIQQQLATMQFRELAVEAAA